MVTVLTDIFWFIITFSILVVLHEGGHFLVARAFGVHVHEFMIGLPGPSIRLHGKKTDYGVTAVPLGGYVKISGMEPGPEDERLAGVLAYVTRRRQATLDETARDLNLSVDDAELLLTTLVDWAALTPAPDAEETYDAVHAASLADDPGALLDLARSTTYRGLSPYKRILVLSAGVVVNLISALLVFVLVLTLVGLPSKVTLTVDVLSPGGGAAKAGIRHGDTITTLDGKRLTQWEQLSGTIVKHKSGDRVTVGVLRDGRLLTIPVTLSAEGTRTILGVQGTVVNVRQSLPEALKESLTLVGEVFQAIAGFFNPHTFQKSVQGSTGVVGIAVMAGQEAQRGPIDYAFFIALLSLSLGAMNILPIPPLDGGKVAIELIEAVRHRPLSRSVSIGISLAGTLLLVTLIGYLMYADVMRIVVGS